MNVAVFESVPRCHRGFAQSVSVLVMHALGDVPTPIAIGALKDALAPACTPDGAGHLGDKCSDHQRPALRAITLGCACYFMFSVIFFSIARCRVPSHVKFLDALCAPVQYASATGAEPGLIAPLLATGDLSGQGTSRLVSRPQAREAPDSP